MNRLRFALSALLCTLALPWAMADIPAGYYTSLSGKKDSELKTAVYNCIHNFTISGSYSQVYSDLRYTFQKTDLYPNSQRWWDMYSDIVLYAPSFSGLNREHSFPKSWWGGSTSIPSYVDLNHLYPSEMKANTAKSNWPLGEVDMNSPVKFDNGICKVGYPVNGQGNGAQSVFEPADEYKGDFARTYFYMVTCYQDLTWNSSYSWMMSSETYPTLKPWAVELLLKWHREDGVSQKEIDRNEAVYEIQNNRNPFIDMPELAEYIWGDKKGESFTPGSVVIPPATTPELMSPSANMNLEFGQVALGLSTSARLYLKGVNLRGALELTLQRNDNAPMFKLSSSSVSASLVNAENGYWLNIDYTPTSLGEHSVELYISEGGLTGSRRVILRGECLEAPTLTACTATAASDIQADSYVANWTAPAGEVIDYYIVTRTRYSGDSAPVTEELVAEDNYLEVTGFAGSDREAYSVQSCRLGVRSPMSNVVFVDHSGIIGVEVSQPLVVMSYPGYVRFLCSEPQHGCRIFDVSGKQVMTIDTVYQNLDIDLPFGVYLIVTEEHPVPLRVAVR